MTLDEIRAIEAYCERATAGKWIVESDPALGVAKILFGPLESLLGQFILENMDNNANFAAKARTDLPLVLGALKKSMANEKRLQSENESLRKTIADMRSRQSLERDALSHAVKTIRDVGKVIDAFRKTSETKS